MKLKILLLLPISALALKCYTCGFSDPKDYCPNDLVSKTGNCDTTAVLGKTEILVCAKTTFMDRNVLSPESAGRNFFYMLVAKYVCERRTYIGQTHLF